MGIDLRDILVTPSSRLPFRRELDRSRLDFPAVISYREPPVGEGVITNEAGVLSLTGSIRARMLCRCDRCAAEFELEKNVPLAVPLASELQDEENPDYFLLDGTELDIDELLETCFILDMDSRLLCRPDCRGLCPVCGANLNDGPCACKPEPDPRLAVLEQLLDDKD